MPIGFIFFDMDETLGFFRNYDGSMDTEGFPTGIFLRRYIKDVLEKLSKDFLLFLTTAATLNYTKAVLEHSDLRKYFHRIFTRNDFVKLENMGDANKEASPGGYEKHYGLIMKHFGIKMNDSVHGLIIGDNDYDISSDVPELKTFIVDSLFVPADILYTIIRDIFDKRELIYDETGIKIIKRKEKHPIADIETEIFEIECPNNLLAVELDKIDVHLSDQEKKEMKVQPEELKETEKFHQESQDSKEHQELEKSQDSSETVDSEVFKPEKDESTK